MNKKICIIIIYFGKFPNTIKMFINSCANNENFNWLFFTDCTYDDLPSNVQFVNTTLRDLKKLIENKLGFTVSLERPYKICDFRPAFGVIFEDYLNEYDFWGYGDIDVVYGNLSHFIDDTICDKYDKIFPCGHLSMIKNREDINKVFMRDYSSTSNYMEVFTQDKSYIFDEYRGINEKLIMSGYKIYGKIKFIDITLRYKHRLKVVDKSVIKHIFHNYPFYRELPSNYMHQAFLIYSGNAYRYILKKNKIIKNEVAYIHYRHKIKCEINLTYDTNYYISLNGIKIVNCNITNKDIKDNNKYPGLLIEMKEYFDAEKIYIIKYLIKIKNIFK